MGSCSASAIRLMARIFPPIEVALAQFPAAIKLVQSDVALLTRELPTICAFAGSRFLPDEIYDRQRRTHADAQGQEACHRSEVWRSDRRALSLIVIWTKYGRPNDDLPQGFQDRDQFSSQFSCCKVSLCTINAQQQLLLTCPVQESTRPKLSS